MLGFDQEFQNGTSRITKVWLNFTLSDGTSLEFHEDRVLFNGFVRDTSTTVDGQFTVGAAVTGKLTLNLDNTDDALSRYDFRGATVVAWLGGEKTDGTNEKVNAGRYYIDEYTYDGSNVTMVGYDDMSKFDVPCEGNVTWPTVITYRLPTLITSICSAAGINLDNTRDWIVNRVLASGSYFNLSEDQPPQWDTLTLHDVISAIAQGLCCYAHIIYVPSPGEYRLRFDWYDTSQLTSNQYDGGTFDTMTTPYSDGATLDGGSFNPWDTGDVADGGAFSDRTGIHIIPSPYDLSVDTDDVLITGVSVSLDPSDNIEAEDDTKTYTKTLGTPGYIIQISGNPLFVTTSAIDNICGVLYYYLNGMRFRPLSASVVENPAMEAGDVAIVTGRNENTYNCFLSHVTYSVNAATQVSCDAESTMQNLKGRFSGSQKIQAMVQRVASERAVSNAETAMIGVLTSYASSRGLYQYTETDSSGGTIYTYGNASTLASSDIRWRVSAGSIMVSTDYGQTWNSALSADGTAVMQSLYAVGINADYIEAGDLTLGGTTKNVDGNFYLKDAQGNICVTMNKNGIFNGKTSINDTTHSGFYLYNDGLIMGDGETERYVRITPDGYVYIHDNLYPATSEETVESVVSFIVEGDDNNGTLCRSYLASSELVVGEYVNNGGTTVTPFSISGNGNIESKGRATINGTISSENRYVITTSTGAGSIIKYMGVYERGGTIAQVYLGIRLADGSTYYVDLNASDSRLKKDISDSTTNALDVINKIRHRSFTWKKNGFKAENGYIAQELRNVIPTAVHPVEQGDGTELLQVSTSEIVPYLSKAIQELSAKVDALEARLAELEGR